MECTHSVHSLSSGPSRERFIHNEREKDMKLDTLRSGPAIVLGLSVFALADLVGAQDAGAPWPNGDQQVRGMCYQPLPEGSWTSTGAAGAEYAQSDVNVDQWSAL